MTYRKILNLLLWVVRGTMAFLVMVLFIWLLNKYFVPFGKLELAYDFSEESDYITDLGPWQRIRGVQEKNGVWFETIKDDLVYFNVKIPRWFDAVTAEITFANPDHPLFILGVRLKGEEEFYQEELLENKFIEDSSWDRKQENNTILLQKESVYQSVDDFLLNHAPQDIIGTSHYELKEDKIIPDYQPAKQQLIIDHTLRDNHTLYTYIKDEDLKFRIFKNDLNWYAGPDQLTVNVFDQKSGDKILTEIIADDGVEEVTSMPSVAQELELLIPDLSEGVYRLEFNGGKDVLISKIITSQHLVVFATKLFLVDNEEYFADFVPSSKPTTVFTDAKTIQFKTSHDTGLQQISVGSELLEIEAINRIHRLTDLKGIHQLNIPRNNLLIESDGYYAFAEDSYFYPFPENIIPIRYDTDVDSLDYMLANYSAPQKSGDLVTNSYTFRLDELNLDDEKNIRFRLSAPGLGEMEREIEIDKIKITLEKPPITLDNFSARLKNFIKKIF